MGGNRIIATTIRIRITSNCEPYGKCQIAKTIQVHKVYNISNKSLEQTILQVVSPISSVCTFWTQNQGIFLHYSVLLFYFSTSDDVYVPTLVIVLFIILCNPIFMWQCDNLLYFFAYATFTVRSSIYLTFKNILLRLYLGPKRVKRVPFVFVLTKIDVNILASITQ